MILSIYPCFEPQIYANKPQKPTEYQIKFQLHLHFVTKPPHSPTIYNFFILAAFLFHFLFPAFLFFGSSHPPFSPSPSPAPTPPTPTPILQPSPPPDKPPDLPSPTVPSNHPIHLHTSSHPHLAFAQPPGIPTALITPLCQTDIPHTI